MHKYSHYLSHDDWQQGMSHDDHHQSNLANNPYPKGLSAKQRRQSGTVLLWSLIITFVFAIVEGIGGYYTHSIALQSDAIHMLTDAAGLLIAYIANNISKRPATVNLTFGYGNAEAIGALMNCVFTLVLTLALLFEVVHRFFVSVEVHGYGVFVIATIGLLINLILALILFRYSNSLNIKAAFIHVLGDLLGSIVAVVAGVIIYFTGISIVDPILSLVVILLLLVSNYNLIKKSLRVLMAGVPEQLDYIQIGQDMEKIEGIAGVHDLHIWYMTANKAALSAHIVARDPYLWQDSLKACQKMLAEKYHIEHITLQYEFKPDYLCMNFCESQ